MYRVRYLLTPFLYIAVAFLIVRYMPQFQIETRWFRFALAASLVLASTGWFVQVRNERVIERIVTDETVGAISYMNEPGTIIANDYSLALYIGSITQHNVAWSQTYDPPARYKQQHADVVCLFNWLSCDPVAAAQRLDARYVLIDTRWPARGKEIGHLDGLGTAYKASAVYAGWNGSESKLGAIWQSPPDPWGLTAKAPWLTKFYENGSTVVYRVNLFLSS